jgi:tetratricopeptide (TPR) repeat protein
VGAVGLLGERGVRSDLTASALSHLGVIYGARHEFERARDAYEQALEVAVEVAPGTTTEVSARSNLGGALRDLGQPVAAVSMLEQALALADRVGQGRSERAYLLLSLFESHHQAGDAAVARDYLERAEQAAAEIAPESGLRARCWHQLGRLAALSEDPEGARRWYAAEVTMLVRTAAESWDLVRARESLAAALYASDDLAGAIDEAARACRLVERLEARGRSGPTRAEGGPTGTSAFMQLITPTAASAATRRIACAEIEVGRRAVPRPSRMRRWATGGRPARRVAHDSTHPMLPTNAPPPSWSPARLRSSR